MQQYVDLKQQHKDCVLFFRLGDFYETFFEDAHICSKILDIVLTSKNKKADNPIPMSGIPHHSAEKYLTKLVDAWYKVALAEQTGDVIPWQLVHREVVRVVTPWNRLDSTKTSHTYLLALTFENKQYHMAWWDVSTGEFWTLSADLWEILRRLRLLGPQEVLLPLSLPDKETITATLSSFSTCTQTLSHVPHKPEQELETLLRVQSLSSFWQAVTDGRQDALAMLLRYVAQTTGETHVLTISYDKKDHDVLVDDITYKNLEVFTSSYNDDKKYSLLWVLDNTCSAWWSRLLHHWLSHPTQHLTTLKKRQSLISHYVYEADERHKARKILSHMPDGARVLSLLILRDINVWQCLRLISVLRDGESLLSLLTTCGLEKKDADLCHDLLCFFESVFDESWEDIFHKNTDFIKPWFDKQLDEYKKLVDESDSVMMAYRQHLIDCSWVTNLKIKYIKNQWYYIETTVKDSEKFEQCFENYKNNKSEKSNEKNENYEENNEKEWENNKLSLIRRQTLKTAQRYTSPYLDELQISVESARDDYVRREQELLSLVQEKIIEYAPAVWALNASLDTLDVVASHAQYTLDKHLVSPVFSSDKTATDIKWARHLVIEHYLPVDQDFIPNDVLFTEKNLFHIITWPNMGGKSTFLRQNALLILMAHCGLCVAAKKAHISLVDGIFARVWSGDVIAKNQSTFMTEMIEVANIVHNASSRSFVIFDELWRGTSTYDGLALTQAIIDFLVDHRWCQTLIATHYHELVDFADKYPAVVNYSVWVHETENDIVFLKKIVPWWADRSYWIDVAQRAGLPYEIITKARHYLQDHTSQWWQKISHWHVSQSVPLFWVSLWESHPVIAKLRKVDTNTLTPLEALQMLADLKKEL